MPVKDRFQQTTSSACDDEALGQKLQAATGRQQTAREAICKELGDIESFKELAAGLRDDALTHLDEVLGRFVEQIEKAGVHVHWARDASDARSIISRIAREHDVERIVKSKSMVTEEIGLTPHLEKEGL